MLAGRSESMPNILDTSAMVTELMSSGIDPGLVIARL